MTHIPDFTKISLHAPAAAANAAAAAAGAVAYNCEVGTSWNGVLGLLQ